MLLLTLLGVACVAYTAAELARAAAPSTAARFGAVDAVTGRALAVTLDRRTRRDRRNGER
jgi:hypothetical protein